MTRAPIRLTSTSFAVLSLVHRLGEATPYELKQALEKSIANFWPVPHTTFYAEPTRLTEGGLLSEQQEANGRRRKLYALTAEGRTALHEWANSPDVAPPQLRDEAMLKVFAGADPRRVFRGRRDWHYAKLAELEGYLHGLEESESRERVTFTLLAGIAYHRKLLEAIEPFLTEDAAAPPVDQAATG